MMTLLSQSSSAAVPRPYSPVTAKAAEFSCLGRTARLGAMLLPQQISSAGQPLLAAPVRIVSEPDILAGLTGRGRVTDNSGELAQWDWAGESPQATIRSRMTGECDGLMWYEVTITLKSPLKLASLKLEIPRTRDTARYLHAANFAWPGFSSGLEEIGGTWRHAFMPYIWLGDEQRGLAWCMESDKGSALNDAANALAVNTQAAVVRFSANIIDREQTIDAPIVLRFGLQASPVKPVSFEWRAKARIVHGITYDHCKPDKDGKILLDDLQRQGVKTVAYHQMWTDYYGKVTTPYADDLRKLITECHKRGIKLIVYIGYGLARNAPELQGHHDNWSVMPLIPWDPTWNVENQGFDATCARSGWSDWIVRGIDQLFTDYDLDGLYFDGTSEAFRCQNESHGCGYRDSEGKLHPTYCVLDVRKMMRGIADAVHRHKPDGILDVHMSSSLTLPTLSFCDSYWDGEQFEGLTTKDKFELPLHAFRTEFMGYAHGLDAEFLCYEGRPFSLDEAIALAWLHGVEVRPYPGTIQHIAPIWRAMDSFGTTKAEWLPYWKGFGPTGGSGVTCDDASIKASSYLRDGKALIFVSHLKRDSVTATIRLNPATLKLRSAELAARDAITGETVPVKSDSIDLPFTGMTYRLLEIR